MPADPSAIFDDDTLRGTLAAGTAMPVLARHYRVVREIGRGAMGAVFLAEDLDLDGAPVAIKMPSALLAHDPEAIAALKREALVARRVTHPNVVTLRGFERSGEGGFLVMDFVEGRTLQRVLLEEGPLSEDEVRRIFRPIAEALDYAHSEGVVHRDLKPSNILIRDDGRPMLADFGIAREMKATLTRMTGHMTSGTLPYMSPEQLIGQAPSPAQDVYGLAATMYQCIGGNPPFHRGDISYQIVNSAPVALEPATALARVVMRGLAKDPRRRPGRCVDLVAAEERPAAPVEVRAVREPARGPVREPEAPIVRGPPAPTHSPRPRGKLTWWSKVGALLSLAGLVAVLIFLLRDDDVDLTWRLDRAADAVAERRLDEMIGGPDWEDAGRNDQGRREVRHVGTGLTFVLIPPGSFAMGSNDGDPDEEPVHRVTVGAFLLSKTECTQASWVRAGGTNGSRFNGDSLPVEQVSWAESRAWCARVGLRLPSESEWEYACRAGTTTRFWSGDGDADLGRVGWYWDNSGSRTHVVGEKRAPNRFGLHDTHGNVWEWCEDEWQESYSGAPADGSARTGTGSGGRVSRGGSGTGTASYCRSAIRLRLSPGYSDDDLGFRPAAKVSGN